MGLVVPVFQLVTVMSAVVELAQLHLAQPEPLSYAMHLRLLAGVAVIVLVQVRLALMVLAHQIAVQLELHHQLWAALALPVIILKLPVQVAVQAVELQLRQPIQ